MITFMQLQLLSIVEFSHGIELKIFNRFFANILRVPVLCDASSLNISITFYGTCMHYIHVSKSVQF